MRTYIAGIGLAAVACSLACGQSADKSLAFDAASVKPAGPIARGRGFPAPNGGPGSKDPSRIHYPFVSLQFLLIKAYGVDAFQIVGPDWLNMTRFDIDATLPPETTQEQFRLMLQNLLSERFKLTIHRETKELPGYSLVVVKSAPKMTKSVETPAPQDDGTQEQPLKLGPDGFFVPPTRAGIFLQMTAFPGARSTFRQMTMQDLANSLQGQLKRPVVDATRLTGKYDFTLKFSMEGLDLGSGRIPVSPGDAEIPPDIFSALQSQLGLKLESKRGPVDMIVVDHVEKTPVAN